MESLGTEAREERLGAREERLGAREERLEAREERLEAKERVENRKEKRSIFIKSCTKKGMLHFNANRNLFCNFVLRTAVITKFSFPKI